MRALILLSLSRLHDHTDSIIQSGSTWHTFDKIRCLSVVLRICKSFAISHLSLLSPYLLSLLIVYVVSEVSCWLMSGPAPRRSIRGPCPPKRVTVPPTFHPLPSLLNVIDFEIESETDKTAHIRKRLRALASVSNCTQTPPPNTHTHTHVKHTM